VRPLQFVLITLSILIPDIDIVHRQ